MDLTLEQLLASLSTGLDKSASEKEEEDKKDEKEEKEDDKPAFLKKKEDKSEKDEDESEDDDSDGQTKEASAQGAALAREIMEKVAGLNLESVTGMQKTASSAGKTLAQALIQKLASAGDLNTADGITPEAVPNKNQVDNAQMHAEGAATVKPMPTSDGLRPTGTINEIFDAIVADAMNQGAASTDQIHETGVAQHEGEVEDHATPNQIKTAAMNELLEQGFDFDQAAEMIKEAGRMDAVKGAVGRAYGAAKAKGVKSIGAVDKATRKLANNPRVQGLAGGALIGGAVGAIGGASSLAGNKIGNAIADHIEGEKRAAMNELLGQGFDFDQAAEMVKEAGRMDAAKAAVGRAAESIKASAGKAKAIPGKLKAYDANHPMAFPALAGYSAGGYAAGKPFYNAIERDNEKRAAMSELLESGIDFDQAADMVKQASAELEDQFEKAAAVDHLVDNGVDFDDAVELVKQAAEEIAAEEFGMAKAAALGELLEEGFDFDDALEMIKQASAGDLNTADGITPEAVPNKNQVDNAQMHAEGAATVKPMPTSDGLRPTGTINEIFDAVVADALSQGAASMDQIHETGVAQHEGEVEDHATPNQIKTAAMNELLEQGFDFDQAAEMVKEAYEKPEDPNYLRSVGRGALTAVGGNILGSLPGAVSGNRLISNAGALAGTAAGAYHGWHKSMKNQGKEQKIEKLLSEKTAAMNELLEQGFDFDQAADMIKEAGAQGMLGLGRKGQLLIGQGKKGMGTGTKAAIGAAVTGAAVGGGAYAKKKMNEKKAFAMNELLDAGFDFEKAASVVKEAAGRSMILHPTVINGTAKEVFPLAKRPGGLGGAISRLSRGAKIGIGAGAALGAGAAGYAMTRPQEKKAEAMSLLLEQGVDFDDAAEMVKQASAKLGV